MFPVTARPQDRPGVVVIVFQARGEGEFTIRVRLGGIELETSPIIVRSSCGPYGCAETSRRFGPPSCSMAALHGRGGLSRSTLPLTSSSPFALLAAVHRIACSHRKRGFTASTDRVVLCGARAACLYVSMAFALCMRSVTRHFVHVLEGKTQAGFTNEPALLLLVSLAMFIIILDGGKIRA